MLFAIVLLPLIFGCGSENEKAINEKHEQSKTIFTKAILKLLIVEYFSADSSLKLTDEFVKILSDSAELGYKYAIYWDSISKYAKPKEISQQERFFHQKTELYKNDYLNESDVNQKKLFHSKTEKMTKHFIDSTNSKLVNWIGTIENIWFAVGQTKRDMELLKTMSPVDLIAKYPEGRDINIVINVCEKKIGEALYLSKVYQEFSPKTNGRGIVPESSLYETIKSFNAGQKVKFTANVKRAMDTDGLHNEQFTGFNIELTDIKLAN